MWNIFARKKSRADAAYAFVQDKLIARRQSAAKVIRHHSDSSEQFDDAKKAPSQITIEVLRRNLHKTESRVFLLYAVKAIAQSASAPTKIWETEFCKLADIIAKQTSSDCKHLDSLANSLEDAAAILSKSENGDDQVAALNSLLEKIVANARSKLHDAKTSEASTEWLQPVRAKYKKGLQTWVDRAQISRNVKKEDLAEMADARAEDYRRILNILDVDGSNTNTPATGTANNPGESL